jgi:copper resistance protein D
MLDVRVVQAGDNLPGPPVGEERESDQRTMGVELTSSRSEDRYRAPKKYRSRTSPPAARRGPSLLVLAFTAICWLFLMAGEIGEGSKDVFNPEILQDALFDTAFGKIWQLRFLFIVILIGSAALSGDQRWRNMAVASALVLGSLGFLGHAAMESGMAAWGHQFNHAVHLLSAGFWFGGLVALVLALWVPSASKLDPGTLTILRRFSEAGQFAVALVVATGAINTWLIVGGWPMNLQSPYQRLLLTKILLVCAMIALVVPA